MAWRCHAPQPLLLNTFEVITGRCSVPSEEPAHCPVMAEESRSRSSHRLRPCAYGRQQDAITFCPERVEKAWPAGAPHSSQSRASDFWHCAIPSI